MVAPPHSSLFQTSWTRLKLFSSFTKLSLVILFQRQPALIDFHGFIRIFFSFLFFLLFHISTRFCFVFRYTNSSNWLFWFRVNSHMDPVIKKTFLMLCTLFLVPPKQLWSVGALTQPLRLPLSVCLWDTDSGSFRSYGFRSGASVALVSSSHRADVQSDWGSVKFRG